VWSTLKIQRVQKNLFRSIKPNHLINKKAFCQQGATLTLAMLRASAARDVEQDKNQ
jgi:hypothetical protein